MTRISFSSYLKRCKNCLQLFSYWEWCNFTHVPSGKYCDLQYNSLEGDVAVLGCEGFENRFKDLSDWDNFQCGISIKVGNLKSLKRVRMFSLTFPSPRPYCHLIMILPLPCTISYVNGFLRDPMIDLPCCFLLPRQAWGIPEISLQNLLYKPFYHLVMQSYHQINNRLKSKRIPMA